MLKLSPTRAPQKLTYLQLDLIHSSPSLSLGNLTQPHVLWMYLQLVGIHCIFYAFPPFCQIHRCLQKLLEEQVPQGTWKHVRAFLAHSSLVATTVEDVNCDPISVAGAGGPTFTITFSSNTTLDPLRRKLTMLACLLSGNPSRIKEFQRQLLSSSWPPGEMEQRNNTVLHYKVAKAF